MAGVIPDDVDPSNAMGEATPDASPPDMSGIGGAIDSAVGNAVQDPIGTAKGALSGMGGGVQALLTGQGARPHEDYEQARQQTGQTDPTSATAAAITSDPDNAGATLQAARLAKDHADMTAAALLVKGDMQGAAEKATAANGHTPDGTSISFSPTQASGGGPGAPGFVAHVKDLKSGDENDVPLSAQQMHDWLISPENRFDALMKGSAIPGLQKAAQGGAQGGSPPGAQINGTRDVTNQYQSGQVSPRRQGTPGRWAAGPQTGGVIPEDNDVPSDLQPDRLIPGTELIQHPNGQTEPYKAPPGGPETGPLTVTRFGVKQQYDRASGMPIRYASPKDQIGLEKAGVQEAGKTARANAANAIKTFSAEAQAAGRWVHEQMANATQRGVAVGPQQYEQLTRQAAAKYKVQPEQVNSVVGLVHSLGDAGASAENPLPGGPGQPEPKPGQWYQHGNAVQQWTGQGWVNAPAPGQQAAAGPQGGGIQPNQGFISNENPDQDQATTIQRDNATMMDNSERNRNQAASGEETGRHNRAMENVERQRLSQMGGGGMRGRAQGGGHVRRHQN